MRDVLMALGSLLILLLSGLIPPLRSLRMPACLAASLLSCASLVLQALPQIRGKRIPAEEAVLILSTVLAFLLKEYIGGLVTKFAKTERSLIIAIMVIVGLMSGVLSNTGTAAVLIPALGVLLFQTEGTVCCTARRHRTP